MRHYTWDRSSQTNPYFYCWYNRSQGTPQQGPKLFQDEFVMSSRNTYAAGQGIYTNFCKLAKVPVTLTTENMLILLVTCLTVANISKETVKIYLFAVWKCMFQKTFMIVYSAAHRTALAHLKRHQVTLNIYPPTQKPYTSLPSISCSLFEDFTSRNLLCHTINMLLSSMLPSIFGFFCVSEFTITNKGSRDTSYYFPFRTFQLITETIHSYYMQFSNSQR